MATSTLPPQTPQEEDERYNPAQELMDKELNSTTSPNSAYTDSGIDQAEAFANDPNNATNSVREQEQNPDNPMGYSPEGQSKGGKNQARKGLGRILPIARRGGPAGVIIGIIAAVMGTLSSFTPLLPIHVYQAFLEHFDVQNASYTIRTNKVLNAKLTTDLTSGICTSVVNIQCKFARPSNYLLKQMEANGITALDKEGNKISTNGIWPNKRPYQFQYDPDGSGARPVRQPILASNFSKALNSDPNLGAAFNTANKTRLQTFSDSVFKLFADQFGVSKRDPTTSNESEDDVNNKIADDSKGADNGVKDASDSKDENKVKSVLKKIFSAQLTKEATKIGDDGAGGATGLIASVVCTAADGPGLIIDAERAYKIGQLIDLAMPYLTITNAQLAGDGNPTAIEAFANQLTETDKDGRSALDSPGAKYVLSGDTSGFNNDDFRKFVPGAQTSQYFGGAAAILDSPVKKTICAGATSPVTGLIIDVALGTVTFGIEPLINEAGGLILGALVSQVAGSVIGATLEAIPASTYMQLASFFFGDTTKNLSHVDFGNAFFGGAVLALGQLGNRGGNVALKVKDAVKYTDVTNQVNVAYADQDRATHSPLDASNSNTFMGTIVDSLIPLYSQMGSLTSALSSVSNIASISASSILLGNSFAATDTSAQFQLCDDPSLVGVAAGPYCNISYGIPEQYLNMDPQQVVKALVDAGQIDPITGEPVQTAADFASDAAGFLGADTSSSITSLYKWTQLCTDGTANNASNCEIGSDAATASDVIKVQTAVATNTPQAKLAADSVSTDTNDLSALYAIYTIDHRVQKNMDNEDTDPAAPTDDTGAVDGTKQQLAQDILNSGKVSFLNGTGATSDQRKKIFSDIADGTSDGNSLNCGLNIKVLQLVDTIVKNHKSVEIGDTNSLCIGPADYQLPGRHLYSRHIGGNGSSVDFSAIDGVSFQWDTAENIAAAENLIKEAEPLLTKGSSYSDQSQIGQSTCPGATYRISGVSFFPDGCSHVHMDFPTSDDPALKTTNGAS